MRSNMRIIALLVSAFLAGCATAQDWNVSVKTDTNGVLRVPLAGVFRGSNDIASVTAMNASNAVQDASLVIASNAMVAAVSNASIASSNYTDAAISSIPPSGLTNGVGSGCTVTTTGKTFYVSVVAPTGTAASVDADLQDHKTNSAAHSALLAAKLDKTATNGAEWGSHAGFANQTNGSFASTSYVAQAVAGYLPTNTTLGISAATSTQISESVTASMMLTGNTATATTAGGVTGGQSNIIAAALTNLPTSATNLPAGVLSYVGGTLYGGTNVAAASDDRAWTNRVVSVVTGATYSVSDTGGALSVTVPVIAGPQGPAGSNGATGATGPQGPAGTNGATGAQGPPGTNGATGATGPQGPAGTNGLDGTAGNLDHGAMTNLLGSGSLHVSAGDTNLIAKAWQNPISATNWTWTKTETAVTLTGYSGPAAVVIPDTLDNLPVTGFGTIFANNYTIASISGGKNIGSVASYAFTYCSSLMIVTLPATTNVAAYAFDNCASLTNVILLGAASIRQGAFFACSALTCVYFGQNAPAEVDDVYLSADSVTNYVTSSTATGWGTNWNGRPVVRLPLYADNFTAAGVGAVSTNGVTSIIYSNASAFDAAGTAAAATNGINAAFLAAAGGLTTNGGTLGGSLAFGTNAVTLGTNSISLFGGVLNGTNGLYFVPLASTNRYWILGGN